MAVLNVNYESLEITSKNVISRGEEFTTLLNKIKEQNEKLKLAWAGTDASGYTAKVEEQAIQMQKLSEAIYAIGEFLQGASNAYKEAQEANRLQ